MATRVAGETERLPWLTDDRPTKRGKGNGWLFAALSALALVLVAGVSFWLGMRQTGEGAPAVVTEDAVSTATVELPSPADPAVRDVEIAPMPQVEPTPQPQPVVLPGAQEVRPALQDAPPVRRMARRSAPPVHRRTRSSAPAKAKAVPEKRKLQFTDPWESDGASGRMVRIGTFSSLQQGKQAWSRLAKAFPGIKRLPAVVTDLPSLRNGRVYYRLQIGTTSQAHSEVLCQRMRAIGQSCVVVDVAGARRGNKDDGQPAGL
jgi:hypothetical protein